MVVCQVKGCRNRSSRQLKKSMFRIPDPIKERSRCAKWLSILGRERFNIETYGREHNKSRVVCEDHFEPDCFAEDLRARLMGYQPRKRLKPDAVPTIPLPTGKRHSSKTSSSSKRKKQKVAPLEKANNEDYSEVVKDQPSFEEFSIPPLFPSRVPLNDEEEEDVDEPNPALELKSDEDLQTHPTDVNLSTESTSQCSTVQGQEHEIGPYCNKAGISEVDITSDFQYVSPMPNIKNGLVLEIYDYLQTMQMYNLKLMIKKLKRLTDSPQVGNWCVGTYIKRLVERRDRVEPETEKGERDLRYLQEEEFMLTRKKTFTKKFESTRIKGLNNNLKLAQKQREETWKCLDILKKDMKLLRQENTALSERVKGLTTENEDLRATISTLEERCQQLEQFKKKYKDMEGKCNQFPELEIEKTVEVLGEKIYITATSTK